MNEKKWSIEKLDSGGRSLLKRNAGVSMGNNLQAVEAFYRAINNKVPRNQYQEEQWYACLCMECLWKPEDHPRIVNMEELLRKIYQNQDSSDSIKHRIIALLDIPWGNDGYLLGKLSNYSRMLRAKDGSVMPDFDRLADDLAGWNHPDRYVQRRWIKTICGLNSTEKDDEKEEAIENVD